MDERRKFIRFRAPFCVEYNDDDSLAESSGVLRDISMGGARVLLDTSSDISRESIASLSILFPDNTLSLRGRTVWVIGRGTKKEVGLYFIKIPDSYKEDIYNNIFKYFREEITQRWWST